MEDIEALHEAGRVASIIMDKIVDMVKPGVKVLDICEKADALIKKYGVKPSFPINVDINHVAAHYTSPLGDDTTIPYDSLVKIDLGTHVNGYIADTATTVCLDPELRYLVDAAEAALNAAINTVRNGVKATEVGGAIEEAMRIRGFQPIRNLTGHKLSRYVLHAGKSIPNIPDHNGHRIHEGDVYAIEPFSVQLDASGFVQDGAPSNIYRFQKKRSTSDEAKEMLTFIQEEYRTLPFASRWVLKQFPGQQDNFKELLDSRCIMSYPQLIERSRKKVAQAEHTVIVTADGCEVTTA
ncbi:MAG: type II methionyl aminopeptidase [Candidatus Bathyarchaeia archaeon]